MLIETAISLPDGSLSKVQYNLDDIRRHQADPVTGRSLLVLRASSPIATAGATPTWDLFTVLSARLELLSEAHPVALMSDADWAAAQAAHG